MSTVSRGFKGGGARAPSYRRASTWSRTSPSCRPDQHPTSTCRSGSSPSPTRPGTSTAGTGTASGRCPASRSPSTSTASPTGRKLHTTWEGVSLDTLLAEVETSASFALVSSYGGYTTNLPLEDLTDGKAWIAFRYDGQDLEAVHGGPARLLVPHLYLWKCAKWIRGIQLLDQDEPGFWESLGYHNYGDPWREQRFWGD